MLVLRNTVSYQIKELLLLPSRIRTWLRSGIFHHDNMSEEQAKVLGAPKHGLDISAQSCRQGEGPKKST